MKATAASSKTLGGGDHVSVSVDSERAGHAYGVRPPNPRPAAANAGGVDGGIAGPRGPWIGSGGGSDFVRIDAGGRDGEEASASSVSTGATWRPPPAPTTVSSVAGAPNSRRDDELVIEVEDSAGRLTSANGTGLHVPRLPPPAVSSASPSPPLLSTPATADEWQHLNGCLDRLEGEWIRLCTQETCAHCRHPVLNAAHVPGGATPTETTYPDAWTVPQMHGAAANDCLYRRFVLRLMRTRRRWMTSVTEADPWQWLPCGHFVHAQCRRPVVSSPCPACNQRADRVCPVPRHLGVGKMSSAMDQAWKTLHAWWMVRPPPRFGEGEASDDAAGLWTEVEGEATSNEGDSTSYVSSSEIVALQTNTGTIRDRYRAIWLRRRDVFRHNVQRSSAWLLHLSSSLDAGTLVPDTDDAWDQTLAGADRLAASTRRLLHETARVLPFWNETEASDAAVLDALYHNNDLLSSHAPPPALVAVTERTPAGGNAASVVALLEPGASPAPSSSASSPLLAALGIASATTAAVKPTQAPPPPARKSAAAKSTDDVTVAQTARGLDEALRNLTEELNLVRQWYASQTPLVSVPPGSEVPVHFF